MMTKKSRTPIDDSCRESECSCPYADLKAHRESDAPFRSPCTNTERTLTPGTNTSIFIKRTVKKKNEATNICY